MFILFRLATVMGKTELPPLNHNPLSSCKSDPKGPIGQFSQLLDCGHRYRCRRRCCAVGPLTPRCCAVGPLCACDSYADEVLFSPNCGFRPVMSREPGKEHSSRKTSPSKSVLRGPFRGESRTLVSTPVCGSERPREGPGIDPKMAPILSSIHREGAQETP